MDPQDFPTVINIIIGMVVLIPSGFVFYFIKSLGPRYYRFLIFGVLLVVYSAFCFRILGDLQHGLFADNPWLLKDGPPELKKMAYTLSENFKAWLYVFPAVIAAIGANLISHFLIMENPRRKK